jgi:hypothetical protein
MSSDKLYNDISLEMQVNLNRANNVLLYSPNPSKGYNILISERTRAHIFTSFIIRQKRSQITATGFENLTEKFSQGV